MAKMVTLHGGEAVPALGQGTWLLGEQSERRREEIETLREGIERGLTLIDTAEMYGDGSCEEMVGEALSDGWREKVFLVSKVYPHNASLKGVQEACERSLKRLKTDHLDLYLLHWRGDYPINQTIAGFEALQRAGKIRRWGVSNIDTDYLEEMIDAGGTECAVNQILYNVSRAAWNSTSCRSNPSWACPSWPTAPSSQGRLPRNGALGKIAAKHGGGPLPGGSGRGDAPT